MKRFYFLDGPVPQFLLRVAFSVLIGLGIFLGMYLSTDRTLINACNSCFVPFCVLLFIGLCSLGNYFGCFDLGLYGMTSILFAMRKGAIRPYEDLIDYKNKKKITRHSNGYYFIPYLVSSLFFLVPAIVLFLLCQ